MERYKPVKDLPEDIKSLPHEETVCQFCGVSYLVHHEISKLEDKVQELEKEIKRLQSIEASKALWEAARAKLIEEKNTILRSKEALEDDLQRIRIELSDSQSEREMLTEENRQWKKENLDLRTNKTLILNELTKVQTELSMLFQCKAEVSELLDSTSSSLSQWREQCVQKCSSFSKQAEKAINKAAMEKTHLLEELKYLKEQWASTETSLKQSLRENQDSLLKYENDLRDSTTTIKDLETALEAKDTEIAHMHATCQQLKTKAQDSREAADTKYGRAQEKVVELEREVVHLQSNYASCERAMEKNVLELKALEQERKELKTSLANSQEKLQHTQQRVKTLQLEHIRELEAIENCHKHQVDSTRKSIEEQHKIALQEATTSHLSAQRDLQAKLTEVRSTLTACELEKNRLVSNLREQLQKEKDIADRELTDHLNTVKALELSLLQEKRARESLEDKASTAHSETEEARRAAKKQMQGMENKLAEAYQEISTLQRIVERQCEEREQLAEELAMVKVSTNQRLKTQNKKPH